MQSSSEKPKVTSRLPMSSSKKKRNFDDVSPEAAQVLPSAKSARSAIKANTSSSSISSSKPPSSQPRTAKISSTRSVRSAVTKSTVTRPTNPARPVRAATGPGTNPARPVKAEAESQPKAAAKRPKRAAWDTKGKLEDLQEEFEVLKKKIEDKENQHQQVVVEKEQVITSVEHKFSEEVCKLKEEIAIEKLGYLRQKEDWQAEKTNLKSTITSKDNEITTLNDQVEQCTAEIRLLKKEIAMLKLTEKENVFELKTQKSTIEELTTKLEATENKLQKSETTVSNLEQDKRYHETERRKLHNTIQELKGNIRVFCRVRPMLQPDPSQQEIFSYPDQDHKKVSLTRPVNINESLMNETLKRSEKLDFAFDKIFEPDSSQAEVFEEISQLVQSALDGYNVCIFAYGQTGSGKTYTMQGPENMDETTEGMIPRSIEQVFAAASQLSDLGWTYTMKASFLEIYNETIKDLLGNPNKEEKYEIKTASGEVVVTNLTILPVTQPRQVENLFEKAARNRHVAETQCNARSSRSHSVFTLKISGENRITSETCVGTLNLVDLAGSERLKESKSEGERLKETQCINTSLSALGNVIMALAAKKSHIPYRDTKLTYLLQNSLGGNSKTLMFVNVSPQEEHFNETVNSLRFATKVNNCSIGTARKVIKS